MIDRKFRVLIVCTANLCRSPMAEYLLRDTVLRRWGSPRAWVIESAGVHAEPGIPMHPHVRRVLKSRGIDTADFRSRRISRDAIEQADLILTAERSHRAAIVTLMPTAVQYSFTIRQFARMASEVAQLGATDEPAVLGHQLLSAAIDTRSSFQPIAAEDDDLPDPVGRRAGRFWRCGDQLSQLISTVMASTGRGGSND